MKTLPPFFDDNTKKNKYEQLVDFWLSWTLRCAEFNYKDLNSKVFQYASMILSYFVTKKQNLLFLDDKKVLEVNCWKYESMQNGQGDLRFEIVIENGKKYALIFENKVYGKVQNGQLENYREHYDNYYKDKDFEVIYFLYRQFDEAEADLLHCSKNDFVCVSFYDIRDLIEAKELGLTGNDLFDEFWFRSKW